MFIGLGVIFCIHEHILKIYLNIVWNMSQKCEQISYELFVCDLFVTFCDFVQRSVVWNWPNHIIQIYWADNLTSQLMLFISVRLYIFAIFTTYDSALFRDVAFFCSLFFVFYLDALFCHQKTAKHPQMCQRPTTHHDHNSCYFIWLVAKYECCPKCQRSTTHLINILVISLDL